MKNSFYNLYEGKRVLITGDTGFKGSWLAIWLKELGAEVFGYALPPKRGEDNFVLCELESKIIHRNGDIRDKESLRVFFKEVQPDITFHLAAQPLVIDSYNDPHTTFETNLMGTVNFFEAVRATSSVKVALNITSDKCYQNNEWIWGYRENDPLGGKDPYSASKGCSELITASYIHSFFKDGASPSTASARAGNVIGAGDWAENRIVPDFFRAIERNQSLYLRYPDATRPWQHVIEPLSGYLLLGAKLFSNGKSFSGGWNFGPQGTSNKTVLELVQSMIETIKKGSLELSKDNHLHEASLLQLDISKAKSLLKWEPVLDFLQTVDFTAKGYLASSNLYESRVSQIQEYTAIGSAQQLSYLTLN
ncbi:MAG: CDP-glucose 4,6-dehydratase [Ignavibacteria bacterium]|nr:CDP-glucose 4,6-dehydratase [Ignavibacteria bacterium]